MQIVALDPAFYKLYRQPIAEMSPAAAERLRVVKGFEQLRRHRLSARQAAEILGPRRATIYRWHQRLRRAGPRGLERGSCRPHRLRPRTWTPELIACVEALRLRFPAWGKATLTPLVQAEGHAVSQATVGRILDQGRTASISVSVISRATDPCSDQAGVEHSLAWAAATRRAPRPADDLWGTGRT